MCKPSCCTADPGSALGIAIGALVVLAVITVAAPAIVAVVKTVLIIAAIAAASLAALGVPIVVTRLIIRHRRRAGTVLPVRVIRCAQVYWPAPGQQAISRADYLATIQAARHDRLALTEKEDGSYARQNLRP